MEVAPTGAVILEEARREREARGVPDDRAILTIKLGRQAIRVRRFGDEEHAALWTFRRDNKDNRDLAAKLFTLSICDKGGRLLYSAADAKTVGETVNDATLSYVVRHILEFNGIE